jgi:hypothetical protein
MKPPTGKLDPLSSIEIEAGMINSKEIWTGLFDSGHSASKFNKCDLLTRNQKNEMNTVGNVFVEFLNQSNCSQRLWKVRKTDNSTAVETTGYHYSFIQEQTKVCKVEISSISFLIRPSIRNDQIFPLPTYMDRK